MARDAAGGVGGTEEGDVNVMNARGTIAQTCSALPALSSVATAQSEQNRSRWP
jgi:hypothetical protein